MTHHGACFAPVTASHMYMKRHQQEKWDLFPGIEFATQFMSVPAQLEWLIPSNVAISWFIHTANRCRAPAVSATRLQRGARWRQTFVAPPITRLVKHSSKTSLIPLKFPLATLIFWQLFCGIFYYNQTMGCRQERALALLSVESSDEEKWFQQEAICWMRVVGLSELNSKLVTEIEMRHFCFESLVFWLFRPEDSRKSGKSCNLLLTCSSQTFVVRTWFTSSWKMKNNVCVSLRA